MIFSSTYPIESFLLATLALRLNNEIKVIGPKRPTNIKIQIINFEKVLKVVVKFKLKPVVENADMHSNIMAVKLAASLFLSLIERINEMIIIKKKANVVKIKALITDCSEILLLKA